SEEACVPSRAPFGFSTSQACSPRSPSPQGEINTRNASAAAVGLSRHRNFRRRRHDVDGQFAVTVLERFSVDLLKLDCATHDAPLPGVMLGIVAELRHHFASEQLKGIADVLMAVLAGLVEQDHLIDMRGAEAP